MKKISYLITILLLAIITFIILSEKPVKTNILINNNRYQLRMADTPELRAKGLSGITDLPNNEGMLFLFPDKKIREFWMENTLIPLQLIYIADCTIIDIIEMPIEKDPSNPQNTYKSSAPADKAIEFYSNTINKDLTGSKINDLCNRF